MNATNGDVCDTEFGIESSVTTVKVIRKDSNCENSIAGERRNSENPEAEEPIDPRVQVELENLNTLTDLINKLELELDDARADFRLSLSSSSSKLKHLADKLGSCIEKSRPYYDARMQKLELQNETQKAAIRYERAMSAHVAAKEMVKLSEEGLTEEGKVFDPAWQEMLNHATSRVNAAEEERCASQKEHLRTSKAFIEAEKQVSVLQNQLKRSIAKARPYYEMKAQFNQRIDEKIHGIKDLESKVSKAKDDYSGALKRLEGISCEIHEKRKLLSLKSTKNEEVSPSFLMDKLRNLHVSHVQSRPSAIVNPWLSSTSSSSYHPSSDDNDCFSDSGSVETVDTLDDEVIDGLRLEAEINCHLKSASETTDQTEESTT